MANKMGNSFEKIIASYSFLIPIGCIRVFIPKQLQAYNFIIHQSHLRVLIASYFIHIPIHISINKCRIVCCLSYFTFYYNELSIEVPKNYCPKCHSFFAKVSQRIDKEIESIEAHDRALGEDHLL